MEDRTSRFNNLMNCKVNMDFIKNINLPPIKIPKITSRKVFSSKTTTNRDLIQPPQVPSSVISHSPSRISTISSLVDDAPDQENPRFGRLTLARSSVDLTEYRSSPDESTGKPLTLQAKLTKQYKELSDFKFKNILNKKTVVKTTSINVNEFKFRRDDSASVRSDYDFEIQSLPDAQLGPDGSFIEQDDYVRPYGVHMNIGERQVSYESNGSFDESASLPSLPPPKHQPPPPPPPQRIQRRNVEASSGIQPNKSSLFKQVKTMSIKRISDFTEKSDRSVKPTTDENASGPTEDNTSTKKGGISRMSFNRQTFEEACNKAKTKMTNKIQQLKSLQSRMHSQDGATNSHDTEPQKSEPDVIFPRISYGAEDGGFIRSLPAQDRSRPSSRVDMPIGHSRFLQKQDSFESPDHDTCYGSSTENTYERRPGRDRGVYAISAEYNNYDYTRRDTPIQDLPVKKPVRIISQRSREAHRRENSEENIAVSRPVPPVPNPKPNSFHSLSFEKPSKMDMIRKRFSQRHDDSLTNNASTHVNVSSQESDSWIPDVFKGPAQNQINLSVIEETDRAWFTKPPNKRILRKEPSFDIFHAKHDEVFDDFDEALKNAPTVAVAPPKMPKQNIIQIKEKSTPAVIQQALVLKPDEPYLEENNEGRSKHFNKLLTRFQRQSGGSEESTLSVNGEFGNHFDIKSVPFMMNDSSIDRKISPISHHERTIENSNRSEKITTKAEVSSIMETTQNPGTIPQNTVIVRSVSAKRNLRNQETVEEVDVEEESFHSLDYDDCMPYVETKPVIQRRIVRLVYTAEV